MAKYEKYAEYKESGFEWADKLPAHWNSVHLKWISTIYAGGTPSKTIESYWQNGTVPWINSGAVNQTYIVEPSTYITKTAYENSSAKWIPKKALVMALAGQGKTKGMVAQLGIDTTCNQSMGAIIPNDLSYARYLFWWITSNYQNIRNMAGGDLRDGLNLEHLGDMNCPLPTYEETQKIANFLDHETAKIDSLIAKQEKLIELLKEKRQAVISHAVTKGLNPHVTMKDSGVEWLGEVPEHWEIPKLLHITTRIGDGLHSTPLYQEGTGYYFINGNNLVDGKIFIGETAKEVPESEFIKHQVSLDKTTVLLSINGTIGKVAQFNDEPVILGKSASYINCCRELLPNFLMNYLTSSQAKNYYDLEVTGTTIYNLSLNSIRNMKVPLPPIDEQKNIILFIAEQYSKYDRLIQSSEKQNQLLKERRTALISSAVTGKIDVRHHASRPSGKDKKQTEGI